MQSFIPVCVRRCDFRLVTCLLHIWQMYGFSLFLEIFFLLEPRTLILCAVGLPISSTIDIWASSLTKFNSVLSSIASPACCPGAWYFLMWYFKLCLFINVLLLHIGQKSLGCLCLVSVTETLPVTSASIELSASCFTSPYVTTCLGLPWRDIEVPHSSILPTVSVVHWVGCLTCGWWSRTTSDR